jgi:hypothetical protein
LQAVDADGPLLADLTVQRPLLRLFRLLQELGRLPDRDFAGGDLGQNLLFGHGGPQVSSAVNGQFSNSATPGNLDRNAAYLATAANVARISTPVSATLCRAPAPGLGLPHRGR